MIKLNNYNKIKMIKLNNYNKNYASYVTSHSLHITGPQMRILLYNCIITNNDDSKGKEDIYNFIKKCIKILTIKQQRKVI